MKKLFLMAIICLLASASPVSAQLIIRNSGHAEVGVNPSTSEWYFKTVSKWNAVPNSLCIRQVFDVNPFYV